jgi:GNAT superfamily N-acetyltransferase
MLTITHPTPAELETALQVAFKHLSPNESALRIGAFMQQYQEGKIDLNGIFQAKHDDTLVGAMCAQSRPDGSVMLWIPAMAEGFSLEPMLEPLAQFCRSKQAFAAVAMADRQQTFDERTLCSVGQFQFLSDLVYLAAEIAPKETSTIPYRLNFVPLTDDSEETMARLTRLVKATYDNSLDFPDLMQIAPVEQVVQGYKAGAVFRPELWFFIQQEGVDVGMLLLTDAVPDLFELTYMGLLESARGHGFSKEIVRFARERTSLENRPLLTTSVDEKNRPACQTYLSHGFQAWDRKRVYVRFF